jgi:hypothetical protein
MFVFCVSYWFSVNEGEPAEDTIFGLLQVQLYVVSVSAPNIGEWLASCFDQLTGWVRRKSKSKLLYG